MDHATADRIYRVLLAAYPSARDNPRHRASPFRILILTILSAQTTDASVDKVSGELFRRFPTPEALASAEQGDVEEIIHSTGFYHAKARHIIGAAKTLRDGFSGEVPDTMEELLTIPGVGRKTANIVLDHAFGMNEGVAVDTHVRRLAQRIGFSDHSDPAGIERDLIALFPRDRWGMLTDILISHGRAVCTARAPKCPGCPIREECRYYHKVFLPGAREKDR
ncbi:endonuclease-3 [Methanolinea mesophila]|uniref:endonuclease III n=1 Tax=Methanolinea mesophila TaxID=547055 RepID=UPI001AE44186|nr:endonuclease III [Methanolinea mesophila]MBP1928120.1 endonuclease-3 [Methanolinea mesophila]